MTETEWVHNTAIKLLQEGESIDYIMQVTGLSVEQIQKIKYSL